MTGRSSLSNNLLFFFFKQKTAYEITYGDWSSDVCSSDLGAPLGLDPLVEQVLELEAPEAFQEDGGVQARLVDGLAAELSRREERALAHHQTRRIVHHLIDHAREAAPALEAGGADERHRARRPHEEDVLLVVTVARLVGDDRLDLADDDVGRHPQALRRNHRYLPPLHRPDAQMEGAVADHGDERERRERDDDLEEGEADAGDGRGGGGATSAPASSATRASSAGASPRKAAGARRACGGRLSGAPAAAACARVVIHFRGPSGGSSACRSWRPRRPAR